MSYEFKRPLTNAELLAYLEEDSDLEDNDVIDAVYIPPDADEITDEEDLDDNLTDSYNDRSKDIAGTFEVHPHGSNFNCAKESVPGKSSARKAEKEASSKKGISKKKLQPETNWINSEPTYTNQPKTDKTNLTEDIENSLGGLSPLDVFYKFFDDEILSQIVQFSIKYAYDNNRHEFRVTVDQLKRFIGILIFSGYHTLPQQSMYWSKDIDKGIDLVRSTMSRNEFRSIKQNIHLSDNKNSDKSDKFAKLRPLIDALNEKFMQFGIFSRHLSIDEEMVPYFGRHSAKMFIKNKPVRFGFKLWCLCTSTGYLYQFIPYGGANKNAVNEELGLGANVVLNLLSHVDNPSQHEVYFDNFFSSYALLALLRDKGYFAMGTVRNNRIAKCPVESLKAMKKLKRGAHDNMFDTKSEINVIRWNDNAVVTIITNFGTTDPLTNTKRYSRAEKKEIIISQPNAIAKYNTHMGGVDLHDNGIANYRIRIRGKKWWWPLFINMIDSAMVNSWKIYNIVNENQLSQLDFRSYVVLSLLKPNGQRNINLGRSSNASLPNDVQYDNEGHMIIKHPQSARRRCRECRSTTVFICFKCNVHLHTKCFQEFHSK